MRPKLRRDCHPQHHTLQMVMLVNHDVGREELAAGSLFWLEVIYKAGAALSTGPVLPHMHHSSQAAFPRHLQVCNFMHGTDSDAFKLWNASCWAAGLSRSPDERAAACNTKTSNL